MNKNKGKNDGHPDGDVGQGKVLRVNDDGSIPGDNPSPASPVFARNERRSIIDPIVLPHPGAR